MPTLQQLKRRSERHVKKNGMPKYQDKLIELFGKPLKVRRIPTVTIKRTINEVRNTPKSNYNRVISQIKTNHYRKTHQSFIKKKPETIQQISMTCQPFPVYKSTRKGHTGSHIGLKDYLERKKRPVFEYENTELNYDYDLETGEVSDYGSDMDWDEVEIEYD